ncbi:acyltransferase family protein [bacterium]|nr:acyltransferase family protein [bacterium]
MNDKINLLKTLAILIVAAGHLEFSLIPMFPPYSFQVLLFFFISGMLFKEKYNLFQYIKKRFNSLLIPYFLYAFFYLSLTILATPIIGKFWGMPITFKNELLMPFLNGHQIDLISPMWFVPCLFITLIIYKIFSYLKINDYFKLFLFLALAIFSIHFQNYAQNTNYLWLFRSAFALFFIHLGWLYQNKWENKNIFSFKIAAIIIILQSFLWLTNKDYTPQDGIGLHFLLVWGQYNNPIVPILTSLTGIWMSLFIIQILYDKIKNCIFLQKIGQNTLHILANHLLIFNILTYLFLHFKGISFDIKNNADIYWFYFPLKTTYLYFILGIILTTNIGEILKKIKIILSGIKFIKK